MLASSLSPGQIKVIPSGELLSKGACGEQRNVTIFHSGEVFLVDANVTFSHVAADKER